jgi:hypothetical protein
MVAAVVVWVYFPDDLRFIQLNSAIRVSLLASYVLLFFVLALNRLQAIPARFAALYTALEPYVFPALCLPALVCFAFMGLIPLTSHQSIQFVTRAYAVHVSKGCQRYEFYSEPTDQTFSVCRETLPWARNGQSVVIQQQIGPFGTHVVSIVRSE